MSVLPMWSAAMDPRVLMARASPWASGQSSFDGRSPAVRRAGGNSPEHLLLDYGEMRARLDVVEGTAMAGPVTLSFIVPDDPHLALRLQTIAAFRSAPLRRRHFALARQMAAVQSADLRQAGASLREIADVMLGLGAWPGDGEHRKSQVRRMVVIGDRLVRAGPRSVLAGVAGLATKLEIRLD